MGSGVGTRGSSGTIECQSQVWRRAAEFGQNPGYHERSPQGGGLLLDLSRAAAAAAAGMDPTQPFPDDTHDDDMVGPQLVPKMQKTTVGRSRSPKCKLGQREGGADDGGHDGNAR